MSLLRDWEESESTTETIKMSAYVTRRNKILILRESSLIRVRRFIFILSSCYFFMHFLLLVFSLVILVKTHFTSPKCFALY